MIHLDETTYFAKNAESERSITSPKVNGYA